MICSCAVSSAGMQVHVYTIKSSASHREREFTGLPTLYKRYTRKARATKRLRPTSVPDMDTRATGSIDRLILIRTPPLDAVTGCILYGTPPLTPTRHEASIHRQHKHKPLSGLPLVIQRSRQETKQRYYYGLRTQALSPNSCGITPSLTQQDKQRETILPQISVDKCHYRLTLPCLYYSNLIK